MDADPSFEPTGGRTTAARSNISPLPWANSCLHDDDPDDNVGGKSKLDLYGVLRTKATLTQSPHAPWLPSLHLDYTTLGTGGQVGKAIRACRAGCQGLRSQYVPQYSSVVSTRGGSSKFSK